MPWEPAERLQSGDAVDVVVVPRAGELGGGFTVQRALPAAQRQMVGPFIFFDQFGPAVLGAGDGLDVRPHPHIGLATVTYLFTGEILHRDSLGMVQPIRPGEINWMTAGRGIAHSERTPPELRPVDTALFGIQSWLALPKQHEETAPAFVHHHAGDLPVLAAEGKRVCLLAGSLYGERSPVKTLSELFYADVALEQGASLQVPAEHEERAAYVVEGGIEVAGSGSFEAGRLVVFRPGLALTLRAPRSSARLMLLGGAAMEERRFIWWNFVSSSRERIEQAKADWKAGRFGAVADETDFIPLPTGRPAPVQYP